MKELTIITAQGVKSYVVGREIPGTDDVIDHIKIKQFTLKSILPSLLKPQ